MKDTNIRYMTIALNLSRNIVGVRFIDFKEDYDMLNAPVAEKNGPLCYHIRQAMDGEHYKVTANEVSCHYARYSTGLARADETVVEGRSYEYCGLYESKAIAKEIVASMKYVGMDVYGLEIGPLGEMEGADIVIIADYAETIMRVMQGYAYKYGNPKNLSFYGNQAMCSDMISKPFSNNDINISLMCNGTRKSGRFDKGEISVAFPISMFDNIVDGVINTINAVQKASDKKRILSELESPDELGIKINDRYGYGRGLREYESRVSEIKEKQSLVYID